MFGGKLRGEERTRLLDKLQTRPWDFSGQELLHLSTAPVWSENVLAPRRVVLRVFLAAAGDSWVVMPGGLARVSPSLDSPVVSMQRGGGSKDTWVLSDSPVDHFTLQRSRDLPVVLNRGGSSDLPSRAADNLFWLGRYGERCEHLARVLRCILARLTGESGASDTGEWKSLLKLHDSLETEDSRMAEDDPQGHLNPAADFEQEILSLIFEEDRGDSLFANLNRVSRATAPVRDRLSSDLLRVVSQLGSLARIPAAANREDNAAWGYISAGDALAVLNRCIGTLSSLRGIELENITRGVGWRFLSIGRRVERSIQMVKLFRATIVPLSPQTWPMLEMLLEVGDSAMTYRSRYFTVLQAAPVLDLLMNEGANPRSLAFQLKDLAEHSTVLAGTLTAAEWPVAKQNRIDEVGSNLFGADVVELCRAGSDGSRWHLDNLLGAMDIALASFSDAITNTWFSHAETERPA